MDSISVGDCYRYIKQQNKKPQKNNPKNKQTNKQTNKHVLRIVDTLSWWRIAETPARLAPRLGL